MSAMTGRDPFIRNLLDALGLPTSRMTDFVIRGGADSVVRVDATYIAEKPDDRVTQSFELHRPEALIDAMKELAGGKIVALELDEGDTVVLRVPDRLDEDQLARIRAKLAESFGAEHRVLVLDGGAELHAVKAPDEVLDTRSL